MQTITQISLTEYKLQMKKCCESYIQKNKDKILKRIGVRRAFLFMENIKHATQEACLVEVLMLLGAEYDGKQKYSTFGMISTELAKSIGEISCQYYGVSQEFIIQCAEQILISTPDGAFYNVTPIDYIRIMTQVLLAVLAGDTISDTLGAKNEIKLKPIPKPEELKLEKELKPENEMPLSNVKSDNEIELQVMKIKPQ